MILSFLGVQPPIADTQLSILFPTLGAVLSGAVCGDHISPISDTTIMSATSTGSHHIDHVHTQIPYALPTIIGCAVGYFLAGYVTDYDLLVAAGAPLLVGGSITLTIIFGMHLYTRIMHADEVL
jgi:Na+/H+ antiporter NhaC